MSLLLLRHRHTMFSCTVALALVTTFIASALSPVSASLLVVGTIVLPLFAVALLSVLADWNSKHKALLVVGMVLMLVLAEYLGIMLQEKPVVPAGTAVHWYGTLAVYVAIALPQAILLVALIAILTARTLQSIIRTILSTLIVVLYTSLFVYLMSASDIITVENLLFIGILYVVALFSVLRVKTFASLASRW